MFILHAGVGWTSMVMDLNNVVRNRNNIGMAKEHFVYFSSLYFIHFRWIKQFIEVARREGITFIAW
jgi:hypothetical protein